MELNYTTVTGEMVSFAPVQNSVHIHKNISQSFFRKQLLDLLVLEGFFNNSQIYRLHSTPVGFQVASMEHRQPC